MLSILTHNYMKIEMILKIFQNNEKMSINFIQLVRLF